MHWLGEKETEFGVTCAPELVVQLAVFWIGTVWDMNKFWI